MLKLIVLAQETIAKGALEDTSTMLPDTAFTLQANGILQRTGAGVRGKTLAAVAHPCLAEVANGANHSWKSSGIHARMFDHTVASLEHAFDLATLCTNGQTLHTLAEIAKGTRLLLLLALVAVHRRIARKIGERNLASSYLLQP